MLFSKSVMLRISVLKGDTSLYSVAQQRNPGSLTDFINMRSQIRFDTVSHSQSCNLKMWPLNVSSKCALKVWPQRVAPKCFLQAWYKVMGYNCMSDVYFPYIH